MRFTVKRGISYYVRSFLFSVFSRCGRFISRKIFPVFLCLIVCSIPVFATSPDDINTMDMTYYGLAYDANDRVPISVTRAYVETYQGRSAVRYGLPVTTSDIYAKGVVAYNISNLVANHEYNIQFGYAAGYAGMDEFTLLLTIYDGNGNELQNDLDMFQHKP